MQTNGLGEGRDIVDPDDIECTAAVAAKQHKWRVRIEEFEDVFDLRNGDFVIDVTLSVYARYAMSGQAITKPATPLIFFRRGVDDRFCGENSLAGPQMGHHQIFQNNVCRLPHPILPPHDDAHRAFHRAG